MGLFDSLGGALTSALGQAETAAMPALISAVLAKTDLGNMQGLLDQLQQSGLGPQVSSWLGDGKMRTQTHFAGLALERKAENP